MIAVVIILVVLIVGAVLYWMATSTPSGSVTGSDDVDTFDYGAPSVIAQNDYQRYGLQAVNQGGISPVFGAKTPSKTFTHTVNSAVAFAWMVSFVQEAAKRGIYKLPSVLQALGRPDTSPWDYAENALQFTAPATSVIVPALTTGALATGTLIAAPAAAVVGLFTTLFKLDSDIKQRIVEAEICLKFVENWTENIGLPPMALLNALANLVPESGDYSPVRGFGTAFDRTKEPGIAILADMQRLFVNAGKLGLLRGIKPLSNLRLYNEMVNKGDIPVPMYNSRGKLKITGRGIGYWPRYFWSVDMLFLQPLIPQWKNGLCEKQYREALKLTHERTGNPCQCDVQTVSDWMNRGGIYKGTFKGFIQPPKIIFAYGHDPSLDGYNGLDTGFAGIPTANETKPSFSESTWKGRFDVDTNGGWLYVR